MPPDRLLVHDWHWTDEPDTRVRWELEFLTSGTRLRLVHLASTTVTHVRGWSDATHGIRRPIEGGSAPG